MQKMLECPFIFSTGVFVGVELTWNFRRKFVISK